MVVVAAAICSCEKLMISYDLRMNWLEIGIVKMGF